MQQNIPRGALVILATLTLIFTSCSQQPPTAAPAPAQEIEIKNINTKDSLVAPIVQTKRYDQCDSDGPLRTQIQFNQGESDTRQDELTLGAKVSGSADISAVAKIELEGSIQQRFASINTTSKGYQEVLQIEIPARTHLEYTLTWKETRQEGSIEYVENGETRTVDYSYRIGLQLDSSSAKNIACPTPEVTVTPTSVSTIPEATATLQTLTIADRCLFNRTWTIDSSDPTVKADHSTDAKGCYTSDSLGMFVNNNGIVQINVGNQKVGMSSGIFTPIQINSVIDFKVYVSAMYIVYEGAPTYVEFAIAPSTNPMDSYNSARFKLHVEKKENNPLIFFVVADAGEANGVKVEGRHYEYKHTYAIHMELNGNRMELSIDGVPIDETLNLPPGQKVFYLGYKLPILAGINAQVSDITIDGVKK
jgi:hypothetical protein